MEASTPAKLNKRQWGFRIGFYLLALVILALGITMNTKAGLGVSPLISVSFSVATIWGQDFGNMTLILYSSYVLVEMILHLRRARKEKRAGIQGKRLSLVLLMDALQFPLSLVFTRFLNIFAARIPDLATECAGGFWGTLAGRVLFLCVAIVLTGVGAVLSLNMRIIPNPGDGIVQAISDTCGKSVGLCKNAIDLGSVLLTLAISLLAVHRVVGVGLGTVLCVIGVGRVVAVFNYLCYDKTCALAGLPVKAKV